tara:strand:+ start:175 stop:468 length:294 start_codon:yes stop_codon:yes gene_type:complete
LNQADFDCSVEDFVAESGSADSATGGKKFVNANGLAQGSAAVRQNMAIGTSAKERIKASPQHSPTRVHISATNQIVIYARRKLWQAQAFDRSYYNHK